MGGAVSSLLGAALVLIIQLLFWGSRSSSDWSNEDPEFELLNSFSNGDEAHTDVPSGPKVLGWGERTPEHHQ